MLKARKPDPLQNSSLADLSKHVLSIITAFSLLFLSYILCLSVWSSPCVLSIRIDSTRRTRTHTHTRTHARTHARTLFFRLKNSLHSHVKTKTFGYLSLACAAPSVWSSLPRGIRHIQSTTALTTAMKTCLFRNYHC